jgi:hypothetical protein
MHPECRAGPLHAAGRPRNVAKWPSNAPHGGRVRGEYPGRAATTRSVRSPLEPRPVGSGSAPRSAKWPVWN